MGMPFISPYSDFSELKSGTPEKEKHVCAVVHEILNLTLKKRTSVDHLTHFREEFRFSQQLRGMLIRDPDMFYVPLKGDRVSVFLRSVYHDSQLLEKDKLLLLEEKMRALVAIPRFSRRFPQKNDVISKDDKAAVEGSGETDNEDWSDTDNFLSAGDKDDDYDGEDDWSDEEDDVPPDFDNADGSSLEGRKQPVNNVSANNGGKVLTPVFPYGRPRERW